MNAVIHFMKDEEGATAIEYGVIAGLITIMLVALFKSDGAFGGAMNTLFTNLSTQLRIAVPGAAPAGG